MFRKTILSFLLLLAVVAVVEKTEAQYNAEIRRLEAEIRQNHPEVQWVNGKLNEVII